MCEESCTTVPKNADATTSLTVVRRMKSFPTGKLNRERPRRPGGRWHCSTSFGGRAELHKLRVVQVPARRSRWTSTGPSKRCVDRTVHREPRHEPAGGCASYLFRRPPLHDPASPQDCDPIRDLQYFGGISRRVDHRPAPRHRVQGVQVTNERTPVGRVAEPRIRRQVVDQQQTLPVRGVGSCAVPASPRSGRGVVRAAARVERGHASTQ